MNNETANRGPISFIIRWMLGVIFLVAGYAQVPIKGRLSPVSGHKPGTNFSLAFLGTRPGPALRCVIS
jgi:hypothetical protein